MDVAGWRWVHGLVKPRVYDKQNCLLMIFFYFCSRKWFVLHVVAVCITNTVISLVAHKLWNNQEKLKPGSSKSIQYHRIPLNLVILFSSLVYFAFFWSTFLFRFFFLFFF